MLQPALAALADPNRFRIVELLLAGPRPVSDIATQLGLNQPQVSKHLKVLKATGWLDVEPQAQQRLYQLQPAPLRELAAWLERYRALWDARFAAMDDLLDALAPAGPPASPTPTRKPRRERN